MAFIRRNGRPIKQRTHHARLKNLANMRQAGDASKPSPQLVKPAASNPEESRQQRFRRCYDYSLRNILERVTVIGRKTRQRLAIDASSTRARIRSLARKQARLAAKFA